MRLSISRFAFVLIAAWGLQARADAEPLVVVSVAPMVQIVERLAGGRVEVRGLVPAGADVETYSPTLRQMSELARARLVFEVGHSAMLLERRQLAPFLEAHPEVATVRLSDFAAPGADRGDPHLWLSARLMRAAAAELAARLVELLPAAAGEIRANALALDAEIAALDAELTERLGGTPTKSFLVFHPALGILASDYGLEQVAIERDGKEPSPAQLARTVEWARHERVRVVLVQRGLPTRAAESIAREIGGRTLEIAPLDTDWLASLRRIAAALEVALDRG